MNNWSEPSLVQKPSYRDQSGGSYYGVSEHMQPLGEAPNARVKARVKPENVRRSVLGKGGAAMGLDPMETPEGTPAPVQTQVETPSQPRIVVEDERDDDYAPTGNGKKKERSARPRTAQRRSEATPIPSTSTSTSKPTASKPNPPAIVNRNRIYSAKKLKSVVEAAKTRALDVGKPDLAAAVNAIHERSLYDARLTVLLEAILTQDATEAQTKEFHDYVRAEKKKLKENAKEATRKVPESTNGAQPLPLRSPAKFTPADNSTSAIPSTEQPDPPKAKSSVKLEPPAPDSGRRRSSQSGKMSVSPSKSPSKKRSGSVDSDSSLTDMTSNPDDEMDVDEPDDVEGSSLRVNGVKIKDHAAERGSLAAPNRNLKRSSAEADIQDDERDRILASKKQKLNETVTREYKYQESNLRGPPNGTSSRLRSQRGKNGSLAPPSSAANNTRNASTRGSRAVSTDLDSPLSSPASSRKSTPQVSRGPAKTMFGKRAKTKQS